MLNDYLKEKFKLNTINYNLKVLIGINNIKV